MTGYARLAVFKVYVYAVVHFKLCYQIADFGMARDLMDENYYVSHGGMIPVKWTAPEASSFI